jgi:drug/metabolite transporter (DMT)-like permease
LILVVVALSQGGPAFRFAPSGWGAIATLAVVSTVLAFIAFLRGLAVIGPVRTAIVSTVEPFWTALLGSLVLAQRLGPRTLAGGVCIAAAVILLQVGSHTRTAAPSAC